MRIFQPKRTPAKGVTGAEKFSDNPLTPGDKTDKTPQTEVLAVLSPPLRGFSENFEGVSTPQGEDGPSHRISPDSHPEDAKASLTTRLLETGKQLGWKPDLLAEWQDWAATAPLDRLKARVEEAEGRLRERVEDRLQAREAEDRTEPMEEECSSSSESENPRSDERKIAELVARYQAGQFSHKVRTRLAEIFEQNPPDAEERVLRACEYLGITGEGLEEADRLAQEVYGR
jgi:hypothetical protein